LVAEALHVNSFKEMYSVFSFRRLSSLILSITVAMIVTFTSRRMEEFGEREIINLESKELDFFELLEL
jgi:hypothetical protein